jgi:hypothetical protein
MVWTYATRVLAAALFTALMYGVNKLAHIVVDLGAVAWLVSMAALFWMGIAIENADRKLDGRALYSLRESRELLMPLGVLAALIVGCWIIDYRERPALVDWWIFAIAAIWVTWNVIELRKERRADRSRAAAPAPRPTAPEPSKLPASYPSCYGCDRASPFPWQPASDRSS